jgi:hypothetical protein
MMPSQRNIIHAQALKIDLAYDSGIKLIHISLWVGKPVGKMFLVTPNKIIRITFTANGNES